MVFAVEAKVSGVVMTSSPGPMPCVSSARCSAAVQELTATQCFAPTYAANCFSNSMVRGPFAHQPERMAAASASTSASEMSGRQNGIQDSLTANSLICFLPPQGLNMLFLLL